MKETERPISPDELRPHLYAAVIAGRRALSSVLAGAVFLVGALLVLYGLFGLTFDEPGGGSSYVTLAGHELDAHLVGASSLVIGLAVVGASFALGRRRSGSRARRR